VPLIADTFIPLNVRFWHATDSPRGHKVCVERTADILHLETIETLELSVAVSSILRLLRIYCSNSAVCIQ